MPLQKKSKQTADVVFCVLADVALVYLGLLAFTCTAFLKVVNQHVEWFILLPEGQQ